MRKGTGNQRSHEEGQADLFGGAPPASRKARTTKTARQSLPPPRATQSTKPAAPDALLNVRQAAARLGLSKSTLDKMRDAVTGRDEHPVPAAERLLRAGRDMDRQRGRWWRTNALRAAHERGRLHAGVVAGQPAGGDGSVLAFHLLRDRVGHVPMLGRPECGSRNQKAGIRRQEPEDRNQERGLGWSCS